MANNTKILPVSDMDYRCDKCHRRDMKPDNFYRSNSPLYENCGCMPICKDCLAELYNKYLLEYTDVHKAIKRLCMAYDLYYEDALVDACIKSAEGTPPIGSYMKKLNMFHIKNKHLTFDQTIRDGFIFDPDVLPPKSEEEKEKYRVTTIPETVRAKWGHGFTDAEYKLLEEHYRFLKKANPDVDSNQEIFIMELCRTEMLRTKAIKGERIDDYTKLTETYRKTFTQAGLKTITDTTSDNDESWGEWQGRISKYTPEEYYKDKKLYKDFDGLYDYFKRVLLRPLKNLQFGTTDRDPEFYVSEEEE